MSAPSNLCGGCTACCRVLEVPALPKAAGVECPFCDGAGCVIYPDRPSACRNYRCGWLSSQIVAASMDMAHHAMGAELRPDRCGVIVDQRRGAGVKGFVFFVHPDRARDEPWTKPPVSTLVAGLLVQGWEITIALADSAALLSTQGGPDDPASR